ncbi:MAG: ADP compounds hydrolase NudE [Pantoea sp. Brub]|nr:ADP compounds hydrolase NudE [Pantoea sp. Brub]
MKTKINLPKIINIKTVANTKLFNIESIDLMFSNGEKRIYERIKSHNSEMVIIVPIINNYLILIHEYAVGIENYMLGFPKGLINYKESVQDAANRELKEEIGFGAKQLFVLDKLIISPSYFFNTMHIVVAKNLYIEKLLGDEPEPLITEQWPVKHMLELLKKPTFCETRNVSALFVVREWLVKTGYINY